MSTPDSIFDYVMSRLRDTETPLTKIAAATGLKPRWLTELRNGGIPEPGVIKIELLAGYFREKEVV